MRYVPLLVDPLVVALIVLLSLFRSGPARPWWLVAAAAYIMLDGAVTIVTPNPFHWRWNWLGKAASVALAALTIRAGRLFPAEVGIAAPRAGTVRRAFSWGAVAVAVSVLANYLARDHRAPGLETLAFQATMPGFSEELAFRGVLIGLFARAYDDQERGLVLAGVASTLVFGLRHGLTYDGAWRMA